MLQAQELRIGNLILWNPKLTNSNSTLPAMHIEVFEIMRDKIAYVFPNIENRVEPFEDDIVQMGSRTKQYAELEPVMLTPGILLNAGFKEKNELFKPAHFLKNDFIVKPDPEGFELGFKSGGGLQVTIKHLHQLQNIYFAIAGEELYIEHNW